VAAAACDRPARTLLAPTAPAAPLSTAAPAPPPPAPPPPAEPALPPPPREPPPLTALSPIVGFGVEGFGEAVASLPMGARGRRPVIIATHGNYDRPEWQCEVWREIVGDRAFVLCPRGTRRPDSPSASDVRFTYDSNLSLEREVDAALAALVALFPEHVDAARPIYTGFSLGAIMGVSIASRRPATYPRAVLVEGGHDKWTPAAAKAFVEGGGRRVLFVCSQAYCAGDARAAAGRLARAGAEVKVVRGPDVGHRYDGPTAEATKQALPWLVEGDDRWAADGGAPSP
jgi:predicted esterase